MTNIELKNALKALEARLVEAEKKLASHELRLYELENNVPAVEEAVVSNVKNEPKRGLCPKCKVQPNHYFHVKWCKG